MRLSALLLFGVTLAPAALPYSVLTHEAIVDAAWNDSIQPLLKLRFPDANIADLRKAHAYAYGGSIIQDLGYYPFGNRHFSDMVHYVRSGDFIESLMRQAGDLNEYAFALGALAHAASDIEGHSIATNPAVARIYPKLKARCGNVVTYGCDPVAHVKVEFGFDVSQVARQDYAPDAYHDFIGFEVSKPLIQRAFRETYGFEFDSLFFNVDLTLGTFRYTVSTLIPQMTKVAWVTKEQDIAKLKPGITRKKYVYNLSHSAYRKEWGGTYRKPGLGSRFLALLFRLIPKVGPFHTLAFHPLDPESELLFMRSFDATLDRYRAMLREARGGPIQVPNINFDTGEPLRPGAYKLADAAYAALVNRLAANGFAQVDAKLRADILAYYANPATPAESPQLRRELEQLKPLP